MSLGPFFDRLATRESHTDTLSSILPAPALMNESAATGLGLDSIDRLGPTQLVNLVTYMITNNLPGEANSQDIYRLLKAGWILDLLPSLASVNTLTTKALLEGIFRLAMEDLDIPIVKQLLRINVDPNGHQIVHTEIGDTLNALQYACICGQTELAQALLEAGATVKEDRYGWKRSILTIAIVGNNTALFDFYADVEQRASNDSRDDEMGDDEENDVRTNRHDNINNEYDEEFEGNVLSCIEEFMKRNDLHFIELAESLIRAGAKVVFRDDDKKIPEETWDSYWEDTPHAFRGCNSPLTAAAKYKCQHLVDKFLSLGADANLMREPGESPLQQCFFSVEEALGSDDSRRESVGWTLPDLQAWMLARADGNMLGCENITAIAKSLLQANANPDELYQLPDGRISGEEYQAYLDATPLNMAILGGFEDLVETFLSSGAKPNRSCLEYAVHGGNRAILERILDTDAPLSYRSIRAAIDLSQYDIFALLIAERTTPLSRTMAVIEAVRSDIAEDLLDFQNFDSGLLKDHLSMLHKAVDHCCSTSTARADLFSRLLTSRCALHVLLLPTIPYVLDSIAQAGSMELWKSLTKIVGCYFVMPTAWADVTVLPMRPKPASHRHTTTAINSYRGYRYQGFSIQSPTLLQLAVEYRNVTQVKHLLEQQADPNLVPTGSPPGMTVWTYSHTPLQIAARNGSREIIRLLLEYGANVNAPPYPDSGATALQFTAIGGFLGIAVLFLDYQVDLDAAGAPINGRTALEGAAEHGRIDMLKMLLNAGVSIHGDGQVQFERALEFASNNGHHAARQMLEEHHD
jgi:ankyrin repeat protein